MDLIWKLRMEKWLALCFTLQCLQVEWMCCFFHAVFNSNTESKMQVQVALLVAKTGLWSEILQFLFPCIGDNFHGNKNQGTSAIPSDLNQFQALLWKQSLKAELNVALFLLFSRQVNFLDIIRHIRVHTSKSRQAKVHTATGYLRWYITKLGTCRF